MKSLKSSIHLILLGILCAIGLTPSYAKLPLQMHGQEMPSLAPMLKQVLPAVVNVTVIGELPALPSALLKSNDDNNSAQNNSDDNDNSQDQGNHSDNNDNAGPVNPYLPGQKFMAQGSGVIVDANKGYIVTNAHVIKASKQITITLKDGRQYLAKVIGADDATDIAVLQVKAKNLTSIPFVDSNTLSVGDFVVAVGNPFGLNQTVTSGIVSALKRTRLGIEGYEDFIQTDASINPGNSGGAVVNLDGKLVGINTAILAAKNGGNVGIGFAIPSDMVQSIIKQLEEFGSVHRGLLGVMVQSLTPGLSQAFGLLDNQGAVVTMVAPNSPAAKAGFKPSDIITRVNGTIITSASDVTNMIGLTRVGTSFDISILRNGKPMNLTVTTASPKVFQNDSRKQDPFLYGINLHNFSQLNTIHGQVNGVQVVGIAPDAPALQAIPTGLRPGDVIISANGNSITQVQDLQKAALEALKEHKVLLLNVLRGPGAMFVVIK